MKPIHNEFSCFVLQLLDCALCCPSLGVLDISLRSCGGIVEVTSPYSMGSEFVRCLVSKKQAVNQELMMVPSTLHRGIHNAAWFEDVCSNFQANFLWGGLLSIYASIRMCIPPVDIFNMPNIIRALGLFTFSS